MCQGEIAVDALERRYAIDFDAYFADALERLQPLAADGLVRSSRPRSPSRRAAACCCVISRCASTATSTTPAGRDAAALLARDLSRARATTRVRT